MEEYKKRTSEKDADLRKELEKAYEECRVLRIQVKDLKKEAEQKEKVKEEQSKRLEFSEKRQLKEN